jgi:hypothetical protein
MKANLRDLIGEMESQDSESTAYFNIQTGQALTLLEEEMAGTDESFLMDEVPAWMQDRADLVKDVLESGNYLELPSQWDINEYQMISDFSRAQVSGNVQIELLDAIRGRGAFRRFKDTAFDLGVIEQWYEYKDKCYEGIAIAWCQEHDIEYERGDT